MKRRKLFGIFAAVGLTADRLVLAVLESPLPRPAVLEYLAQFRQMMDMSYDEKVLKRIASDYPENRGEMPEPPPSPIPMRDMVLS